MYNSGLSVNCQLLVAAVLDPHIGAALSACCVLDRKEYTDLFGEGDLKATEAIHGPNLSLMCPHIPPTHPSDMQPLH